jgi:Polyketide cyclase / dehydrase and lipid transport
MPFELNCFPRNSCQLRFPVLRPRRYEARDDALHGRTDEGDAQENTRITAVKRSAQMPATVSCRVEQPSTASPASVYDALMDFERWSDWMPTVSAALWERHGAPGTGVGGIRRVRVGPCVTHDHIVEGTKPTHHAYSVRLPWWVPQGDFRGDVRIEDCATGSLIIWTATCTPRLPGLRKIMEFNLQATYKRIAVALAREAERTVIG